MSESWGYARVSIEEQQSDGGALVKQIEKLQNAGCSRVYWDIQSRTTEIREGLQQLIADLKSLPTGKIKSLVFTRIDRIGSSSKLFYSLLEILRSKGIKLQGIDQSLDADSLGGELTIDMLLAASKFEVKMLQNRIKSDYKHRRNQGKSHNIAPFGYQIDNLKYVRDKTPCVCLIESKREFCVYEIARYIFDIFFEVGTVNGTCRKIHEVLGITLSKAPIANNAPINHLITNQSLDSAKFVSAKSSPLRYPYSGLRFSVMSIRTLLVNPVYAGGSAYNTVTAPVIKDGRNGRSRDRKHFDQWEIVWDTHPEEAIITRLEHEQVKTRIRNNNNNKWGANDKTEINPFANLVKCARCGAAMTKQNKQTTSTGNTYRFQCRQYRFRGCDNKKMIENRSLEKQVIDLLLLEAQQLASMVDLNEEQQEPPEVLSLRDTLAALEKLPSNPNIEQAKRGIKDDIASLLKERSSTTASQKLVKERLITMFSTRRFWEGLSPKDKKQVLGSLVRRILVDGNQVVRIEFLY
jgi:site-specific DNA recombinase